MRPRIVGAVLVGVLLVLPTTVSAQDLSGGWRGRWYDTNTGHEGPLRAHLRCEDGRYHALFTGRFFGVVPFVFRTDLCVVSQTGDCVQFAGQSRLPFFGEFRYDGWANGCHFHLNFCSARYVGRFEMDRGGH
jgi:hypothetical protein